MSWPEINSSTRRSRQILSGQDMASPLVAFRFIINAKKNVVTLLGRQQHRAPQDMSGHIAPVTICSHLSDGAELPTGCQYCRRQRSNVETGLVYFDTRDRSGRSSLLALSKLQRSKAQLRSSP